MDKLLLIDIGGTHMRHAIASANSNEITEINIELQKYRITEIE